MNHSNIDTRESSVREASFLFYKHACEPSMSMRTGDCCRGTFTQPLHSIPLAMQSASINEDKATANAVRGSNHHCTTDRASVAGVTQGSTGEPTSDSCLSLEEVLPVTIKLQEREEGTRELGVYIRTGRGGASGVSRLVIVRLTDPLDPYFLYELELPEDDYGAFKNALELLVDFNGFPRYLASMVQGIVAGVSPYEVRFTVPSSDAGKGTLRILERTEFKTVEHISLIMLRQGDVGQKQYLAEQFQLFRGYFLRSEGERREDNERHHRAMETLQRTHAECTEERDRLREVLRVESAKSDSMRLADLEQMRCAHTKEISDLRNTLEEKLRDTEQKATELQMQLLDDVRTKDKLVQELRERNTSLESHLTTMRSQLRMSEDTATAQDAELVKLRQTNEELTDFKLNATKAMSENELNYVSLTERLRAATTALQSKETELEALREQYEKQDNYIRILSTQNDQMTEQSRSTEKALEKANHIISHQLQTIKGAKERYRIVTAQLRSQEELLHERQRSVHQLKDELTSVNDRLQTIQRKNGELKEQLQKTDDVREKLAQELKQSQDALIHLQRNTSINGRHWGVLGGRLTTSFSSLPPTGYYSAPTNTTAATGRSPSVDVYQPFSRNRNTYTGALDKDPGVDGGVAGPPLFTSAGTLSEGGASPSQVLSEPLREASLFTKTEPREVSPAPNVSGETPISKDAAAMNGNTSGRPHHGGARVPNSSLSVYAVTRSPGKSTEGTATKLSSKSFFDAPVNGTGPYSYNVEAVSAYF